MLLFENSTSNYKYQLKILYMIVVLHVINQNAILAALYDRRIED